MKHVERTTVKVHDQTLNLLNLCFRETKIQEIFHTLQFQETNPRTLVLEEALHQWLLMLVKDLQDFVRETLQHQIMNEGLPQIVAFTDQVLNKTTDFPGFSDLMSSLHFRYDIIRLF